MTPHDKSLLTHLLQRHSELGISEQIDYEKFYLYSIITHSTAIEGSTVTEVEAQLLFDEGITSSKRSIIEQNMNLDLKEAYDYGREWIMQHGDITVDELIVLASKVMSRTGADYKSIGGDFSAARGELRKLNVTAGAGGRSYLSYLKVPAALQAFCDELNRRRRALDTTDASAIYDLSFWAHYELVTIHPWADGNGRTSRLLMNLLQMEWGVLPTKVLREDKAEYIQALINAHEQDRLELFTHVMTALHCRHLQTDVERFLQSVDTDVTDKHAITAEITDKLQRITDKSQDITDKPQGNTTVTDALVSKITDAYLYVLQHPHTSARELATHLGRSSESAKKYLQTLASIGMVTPEGANKNRTYSAAPSIPPEDNSAG